MLAYCVSRGQVAPAVLAEGDRRDGGRLRPEDARGESEGDEAVGARVVNFLRRRMR